MGLPDAGLREAKDRVRSAVRNSGQPWPDGKVTQTFDPQSPACIASWPEAAKGNGGATTRGVSTSTTRARSTPT